MSDKLQFVALVKVASYSAKLTLAGREVFVCSTMWWLQVDTRDTGERLTGGNSIRRVARISEGSAQLCDKLKFCRTALAD